MSEEAESWSWNDRRRQKPPPPQQVPPVSANGHAQIAARAMKALTNECEIVAGAAQGTRNHRLNEAAFILGGLVAGGSLPEEVVIENLRDAALAAGLAEQEITPTIRSGLRSGRRYPRTAEDDPPRVHVVGVDAFLRSMTEPATEAGKTAEETDTWTIAPLPEQVSALEAEPRPTHLFRDDGCALFYPGKVNGIIGEAESGKSWLLLLTIHQALQRGERVLLLDFEDAPPGIMARLRALDAEGSGLDRLDYCAPPGPISPAALRAKLDEIALSRYGLVVVDGINAAMTLLGLDLLSNVDATRFFMGFLRPLSATGATVVTADHVPKDPDGRNKGGIGAQAKRAMMDGCCITVEVVQPFGRGTNGILRLRVDKDRPGHVRGVSTASSDVGRALLSSLGEDRVSLRIAAPDLRSEAEREAAPPRRTGLMEKISRYLEGVTRAGFNELLAELGGRKPYIREALAILVEEGWLWAQPAPRNGTWYASRAAYRQSEDPESDLYQGSETPLGPTGTHWDPTGAQGPSGRLGPFPLPPTGKGPSGPGPGATLDRHKIEGLRDPVRGACGQCGREVETYNLDEAGLCPVCHRKAEL